MSKQAKIKKIMGTFLVVTFLAGGLTLAAATKVHAAPKAAAPAVSAPAMININKANVEELDKIRGIGPAMAQRIVDFRTQNGPFKSVDDLVQVRGIGGSKLQQIKSQVTV
ncbi:MAG: ComE operon protein 1 [Candidatus Omnitrophica bacterium ADurb.Bin277]|nr:MAG: ComE operon protein 1 [Candidatus Omnitrophica bacterium ADurb.Bin277]